MVSNDQAHPSEVMVTLFGGVDINLSTKIDMKITIVKAMEQ